MKKFLSSILIITIVFSLVSCRRITTTDEYFSTQSNIESSQSSLPDYDYTSDPVICKHNNTTTVNYLDATCTAQGYTGDIVCNDCKKTIEIGSHVDAIGHDIEIINKIDATSSLAGYSGDHYCKTCGFIVTSGHETPKLQESIPTGKVKYTSDNGYVYIVDKNVDITTYSMQQQTQHIESQFRDIELEILELCNAERAKLGIAPLEWYEDAYYFAHIRADEIYHNWDHVRPNGFAWHTVYTDSNVILSGAAENLAQQVSNQNVALGAVEAWMDSTSGHRESILNPKFTKMTVAISYNTDTFVLCVAQHFFN